VKLTQRQLNRTLLARQHLLERVVATPEEMAHHLVGLQAQENLPPYLSLNARLTEFDPYDVTAALEHTRLARLLTMRGTIHLLTASDALSLRSWTQSVLDKVMRNHAHADAETLEAAVRAALVDGPVTQRELSTALAAQLPDVPSGDLGVLARLSLPLAQLPPRGTWKGTGGVIYDYIDRWLGAPTSDPDVEEVVRRYLRASGPASAADVTAWSGVTRLAPVLAGMDDLVRHEDPSGKVLYDVPDGVIAEADTPAPPRLLGTYDNVWLSHAGRDRVTEPTKRRHWMGSNGGVAMVLLVDGMLEGLWRQKEGRVVIVETFRDLSGRERADLDAEIARVETMLER
jgi:hypothetical protein